MRGKSSFALGLSLHLITVPFCVFMCMCEREKERRGVFCAPVVPHTAIRLGKVLFRKPWLFQSHLCVGGMQAGWDFFTGHKLVMDSLRFIELIEPTLNVTKSESSSVEF